MSVPSFTLRHRGDLSTKVRKCTTASLHVEPSDLISRCLYKKHRKVWMYTRMLVRSWGIPLQAQRKKSFQHLERRALNWSLLIYPLSSKNCIRKDHTYVLGEDYRESYQKMWVRQFKASFSVIIFTFWRAKMFSYGLVFAGIKGESRPSSSSFFITHLWKFSATAVKPSSHKQNENWE